MNWKHPLFITAAVIMLVELICIAIMPEIPMKESLEATNNLALYKEALTFLIVLVSASFIAATVLFIGIVLLILKGNLKYHVWTLTLLAADFILPIVYYYGSY